MGDHGSNALPRSQDRARRRFLNGWGGAAVRAVVVALAGGALAETVVFAAYLAGRRTASVLDVARAGGLLFAWFHHTDLLFRYRTDTAAGSFTLGFAPMLGTALVGGLLVWAGRGVARRAGDARAWACALQGAKVAPPYAAVSLLAAFGSKLPAGALVAVPGAARIAPGFVSVRPSVVGGVLWPLALAVAFGCAGGLSAAPRERSAETASPVRGALAGAWWMLAAGLALAFAGLLVLAAVTPHATAAYFRAAFVRGAARGSVLVGLNLLVVPNLAAWVLAAAMGGCVGGGFGVAGSHACLLSLSKLPSGSALATLAGGLDHARSGPPGALGSPAPAGYLAFLLVPAVAVLLGGWIAAHRAETATRVDGAGVGALAGILFAVLVGGVFVLASVVLSTTGARGAPGASFWFGPRMVTGVALAAIWGVVGGAAGGFLFPSRPPPVSAGSTPSPPV